MKNLLRGTALATLLASSILLAPGAHAQTSTFIAATCGGGCSDPLGEEAAARSNWTTLTALGTTQYVGASFNGGTIDASSLLAASRVAGPVVLDTYLRTGQAPDTTTAQAILNALGITGIDVSGITGVSPSGSNNNSYGAGSNTNGSSPGDNSSSMLTQLANVLSGNTNGQFGSAGNASNVACDESIASATVAAAQQHINNMVTIATSGDYGFSQNGGSAVSSGQRSQSGYFGSSCLDSLMQGNRDLLFRPPQLSQLISQLQGMFGSASATIHYAAKGHVDLRRQLPSALLALVGSAIGALLATAVPGDLLRAALPVVLIAIALYFALKPNMDDVDRHQRLSPFLFGLVIPPLVGFYDGLFGPGAGSFYMLGFVALAGYGVLKATAHTKLLNFASNIGGFIVFAAFGVINWKIGLMMGGVHGAEAAHA